GVFVERDRFEEGAGLFVGFVARRARLRLIKPERRNAHGLPGLQPVFRLRALAVDPYLALPNDTLDVGETQSRKARLEEGVEPHAGFVGGNGHVLDAGWRCPLALRNVAKRRGRFVGAARDCSLLLPVMLRRAPTARLEGYGPSIRAVAPPEIGFIRFRNS